MAMMALVLAAGALLLFGPAKGIPLACSLAVLSGLNFALFIQTRDIDAYRVRGIRLAAHLRVAEGAVIAGLCLVREGAQGRLWLLAVPLIIAAGLVERNGKRPTLIAVTVAVSAVITAWTPQPNLIAMSLPILALFGAAASAAVLTTYREREETLQARDRRMGTLMQTASAVAGQDLNTTVILALEASVRDLGATAGIVCLTSEDNPDELVVQAAFSPSGEFTFPEKFSGGGGLSGYVVKMGQPISIHASKDEQIDCDGMGIQARAAVSVPLMTRGSNRPGQAMEDRAIGAMTLAYCDSSEPVGREDLEMLRSISSLLASAVSNRLMEERQRTTFLRTLESLATALEARDEYTRGHSHRVCEVSLLIGKSLHYGAEALEELRIGTTLHDIGKIGVPDSILNKPGRLTDDEFTFMKTHPVIGYEICKPLMLSEGVLMIIRNHHEKLDGSGYPDGLKGGELPLSLRIVCVADAFDAMSSRRPYRGVMDIGNVLSELSKGAGVQFDPVVVETLRDLLNAQALDAIYEKYWESRKVAA